MPNATPGGDIPSAPGAGAEGQVIVLPNAKE
jgi:hypothetical protein